VVEKTPVVEGSRGEVVGCSAGKEESLTEYACVSEDRCYDEIDGDVRRWLRLSIPS
jgi:hypothetical protein